MLTRPAGARRSPLRTASIVVHCADNSDTCARSTFEEQACVRQHSVKRLLGTALTLNLGHVRHAFARSCCSAWPQTNYAATLSTPFGSLTVAEIVTTDLEVSRW
jgi:hypothetical protein